MRATGIIAEYNPMHNGHIRHLEKAREAGKADFVVAVMSGDFTQRGEPAIFDKWVRAEMAVNAGIDLAVELPFVYACGSAEYFAEGGVKVLRSLGVIDSLCFGTEEKDLSKLKELAALFSEEPDKYKKALKKHLDLGLSYPKARQLAVNEIMECGNILNKPNNILALEYLKALKGMDDIKPISVYRNKTKHGDSAIDGDEASGSAVRAALLSGNFEKAYKAVPETTADMLLINTPLSRLMEQARERNKARRERKEAAMAERQAEEEAREAQEAEFAAKREAVDKAGRQMEMDYRKPSERAAEIAGYSEQESGNTLPETVKKQKSNFFRDIRNFSEGPESGDNQKRPDYLKKLPDNKRNILEMVTDDGLFEGNGDTADSAPSGNITEPYGSDSVNGFGASIEDIGKPKNSGIGFENAGGMFPFQSGDIEKSSGNSSGIHS